MPCCLFCKLTPNDGMALAKLKRKSSTTVSGLIFPIISTLAKELVSFNISASSDRSTERLIVGTDSDLSLSDNVTYNNLVFDGINISQTLSSVGLDAEYKVAKFILDDWVLRGFSSLDLEQFDEDLNFYEKKLFVADAKVRENYDLDSQKLVYGAQLLGAFPTRLSSTMIFTASIAVIVSSPNP